jgi:hypothetical protein
MAFLEDVAVCFRFLPTPSRQLAGGIDDQIFAGAPVLGAGPIVATKC